MRVLIILLFCVNCAYAKPRSESEVSNQLNNLSKTIWDNCKLYTSCKSENDLRCLYDSDICKEVHISRCKIVIEELEVWRTLTKCENPDDPEDCQEVREMTIEESPVEKCKIKKIPASECKATMPSFVCQRCKVVIDGIGCDLDKHSCDKCSATDELDTFSDCLKTCAWSCDSVFPDSFVPACTNCVEQDCSDPESLMLCLYMQHLNTPPAPISCPLPQQVPGVTGDPVDRCVDLCPEDNDDCRDTWTCEQTCSEVFPLLPVHLCKACYLKGYRHSKAELESCLALDFRAYDCANCFIQYSGDDQRRHECIRENECQESNGDWYCHDIYHHSPDHVQECLNCVDQGCQDYDEARLCTEMKMDHQLDIICENLPSEFDAQPQGEGSCAGFCPDDHLECQDVKDGLCVNVCKTAFPFAPPYLCDYCAALGETTFIDGCITDHFTE